MAGSGTDVEVPGINLREIEYRFKMQTDILTALAQVIESRRKADASSSYVASLHAKGTEAIADKVLEEAQETAEAANAGDVDQVVYETADLWFHSLVLLSRFDLNHEHVLKELNRRFGVSGCEEKKSRTELSKSDKK